MFNNLLIISFDNKRNLGLDILRAIAILLVLLSHGRAFFIDKFPFLKILSFGGFLGVELFFVLSGFLIGKILINLYINTDLPFRKVVIDFWLRRWIRTLPIYYIVIVGVIFLDYLIIQNFDYLNIKYFYFFQNFIIPESKPRMFGVGWSLSVEEWFYLIIPITLLIFSFFGRQSKKSFLIVILFFIITSIILRYIAYENLNYSFSDLRNTVVFRLDAIIYGALMSFFFVFKKSLIKKNSNKMAFIGLLFIFISFLIYNYFFIRLKQETLLSNVFLFNLISMGFMLIIPYFYYLNSQKYNLKLVNLITYISLSSYSIYLIHAGFIRKILLAFMQYNDSFIYQLILYIFYWTLSLSIGILMYNYIEKRILDYRDRIVPNK